MAPNTRYALRSTLFNSAPSRLCAFALSSGRRVDWLSLAAFSLPLLLYRLTLAPTIYNLDSAEFTVAVASNGLVRATGYPLYLLLGKLWTWLPLGGDMGYRLNLFSAVCGAATILLAERILRRLAIAPWARLGALGLLATAPFFWSLSLIAEVYTLHTALMAAILLALIRWAQAPTPRRLALVVLIFVLSLGNHAATILLLPGCVLFVLASRPRQLLRPRLWLAVAAAAVAGAAIFLLLPWRYAAQPAFNYAGHYDASGAFIPLNLQTWPDFWRLITGQGFAGLMFGYRLTELWSQISHYGAQLWLSFLAIGIGPGILGAAILWRRDRRLAATLLLFFFSNAIFYINYRVVDKDTMFLPTYLIWAIWLAAGYDLLLRWAGQRQAPAWLARLTRALLVAAVVVALSLNWRAVDLSDDWSTRQQSQAILDLVEPNALVLGWWDTIPAIQYLQLVEGQRPDVTTINRFLIRPEDMKRLVLQEVGRRPVYINNPSVELLQSTSATAAGPLYRLQVKAIESRPD